MNLRPPLCKQQPSSACPLLSDPFCPAASCSRDDANTLDPLHLAGETGQWTDHGSSWTFQCKEPEYRGTVTLTCNQGTFENPEGACTSEGRTSQGTHCSQLGAPGHAHAPDILVA